jgi:hypothetical protein
VLAFSNDQNRQDMLYFSLFLAKTDSFRRLFNSSFSYSLSSSRRREEIDDDRPFDNSTGCFHCSCCHKSSTFYVYDILVSLDYSWSHKCFWYKSNCVFIQDEYKWLLWDILSCSCKTVSVMILSSQKILRTCPQKRLDESNFSDSHLADIFVCQKSYPHPLLKLTFIRSIRCSYQHHY